VIANYANGLWAAGPARPGALCDGLEACGTVSFDVPEPASLAIRSRGARARPREGTPPRLKRDSWRRAGAQRPQARSGGVNLVSAVSAETVSKSKPDYAEIADSESVTSSGVGTTIVA
jgi:hypothetical protein